MRVISATIDIAAAPQQVWADLDAYPQGNPFIRSASDQLTEGACARPTDPSAPETCTRQQSSTTPPARRNGGPAMTTVELTRFCTRPDQAAALLAARPRMLADFRADRPGFLDAQLVRLPGGQWLDIVWWRSPADFTASRAKGANLPGVKAFFDAIGELVSSEEGELADIGQPR
jgi:hypothetical protein